MRHARFSRERVATELRPASRRLPAGCRATRLEIGNVHALPEAVGAAHPGLRILKGEGGRGRWVLGFEASSPRGLGAPRLARGNNEFKAAPSPRFSTRRFHRAHVLRPRALGFVHELLQPQPPLPPLPTPSPPKVQGTCTAHTPPLGRTPPLLSRSSRRRSPLHLNCFTGPLSARDRGDRPLAKRTHSSTPITRLENVPPSAFNAPPTYFNLK